MKVWGEKTQNEGGQKYRKRNEASAQDESALTQSGEESWGTQPVDVEQRRGTKY